MHPAILAKRQLDAQNRIMDASHLLAERFDIDPPLAVTENRSEIAQMMRWEAVADFIEGLSLAEVAKIADVVNDVLSIGLSKTSVAKIQEHYGNTE